MMLWNLRLINALLGRSMRPVCSIAVLLVLLSVGTTKAASPPPAGFNMLPLAANSVALDPHGAGRILVTARIGRHTFRTPLTVTAVRNPARPNCPILHFILGPLAQNEPGFSTQVTSFYMDINPKAGTHDGDLLCRVGNSIGSGVTLSRTYASLGASDRDAVNDVLLRAINVVLGRITISYAVATARCGSVAELYIVLGPYQFEQPGETIAIRGGGHSRTVSTTIAAPRNSPLGDMICRFYTLIRSHSPRSALQSKLQEISLQIERMLA